MSVRNVVVSVLLSGAVLGGIAYFTFDADALRDMIAQTSTGLLLLAIATTFVRVGIGGWRLQHVSQGTLSLASGTRGQLAWEFFSSVTPSAIGGGPVTALYIARERKIKVGEATAYMLFSMLLDQFWFIVAIPCVVLASFYLEVIPASVGSFGLWAAMTYFAGMLAWAGLFAYATLFRPRLLEKVAGWIFGLPYLRRFRERVMREMRTFASRARHLRAQPVGFYVKGFGITALTWIARYLLVLLIIRSVYGGVDDLLVLFRTAAMTLLGLIMPTPGGSGGLEGLYALFLGPLMPDALVAPTLLTWRLLGYYIFIALGAYLFTHQVHRALHDEKTPAPPTSKDTDGDSDRDSHEGSDEDAPETAAPRVSADPVLDD